MTAKTNGGVIFCYSRAGRGAASRALRAAGLKAEYLSSAALADARDIKPTPRYQFNGATEEQIATILAALEVDGMHTEIYYETERTF